MQDVKEQLCTVNDVDESVAEMTAPFLDAELSPVNVRLAKLQVDSSDLAEDATMMREEERVTGEVC